MFLQHFREVFEHPAGGKSACDQLLSLRQGRTTAAEYALSFRTLAAQTEWIDDTLKLLFRKGLNLELQAELACCDEGRMLNEFIELTIQIDNLIRSRRPIRPQFLQVPVTPNPEPMQLGYIPLTPEERERRVQLHLCLYCGQAGHLKLSCPIQPGSSNSKSVSSQTPVNHSATSIIPVKMRVNGQTISTHALLDSGAAGNFMSCTFIQQHNIMLISCISHLTVEALDGRPIGEGKVAHIIEEIHMQVGVLHHEKIRFYVIHSPNNPVILGLPWLRRHNPHISWKEGQIVQWDPACHKLCLNQVTLLPVQSISVKETNIDDSNIPVEYANLEIAFSKSKAAELPPHRSSDCAIDLLPGTSPPKGRIFPLSQPESAAMKKYIEELAKGFIRPSTSPAASGFFFVKKKDGSLRPCIDYHGLNDITVKFCYPLPLVPAALEQLRQAQYFTKLIFAVLTT